MRLDGLTRWVLALAVASCRSDERTDLRRLGSALEACVPVGNPWDSVVVVRRVHQQISLDRLQGCISLGHDRECLARQLASFDAREAWPSQRALRVRRVGLLVEILPVALLPRSAEAIPLVTSCVERPIDPAALH